MSAKYNIRGGVYLVVDPAMEQAELFAKVGDALAGGVRVLQVWNNWPTHFKRSDKASLLASLIQMAASYFVPVLINEEWELLKYTALAGVHFDKVPENFPVIKAQLGEGVMYGITCSNNLEVIQWASQNQFDYVSFCSIFPSASAGACELVKPETIKEARKLTSMPFFLSGGITTENMASLKGLEFNGVAVISGILHADSAQASAAAYQQALDKYTT